MNEKLKGNFNKQKDKKTDVLTQLETVAKFALIGKIEDFFKQSKFQKRSI
jgi:hypothetical protein